MLKDIEKAVRDQAKSGAEQVRIELIKFRRFSGGFFQQKQMVLEIKLNGDKPALLKSGNLSASVRNMMKDSLAVSNVFNVSVMH